MLLLLFVCSWLGAVIGRDDPVEVFGTYYPSDTRRIVVPGQLLSGILTPNISRLSLLEHFDMHGNFITGSIPSQLGQLNNLQHLDCSVNMMHGAIPSTMGQLTRLTFLDLSSLRIIGVVPEPIFDLPLEHFGLDGSEQQNSNIINLDPMHLPRLKQLRHLSIGSLRIGTIPTELGMLTTLEVFAFFNLDVAGTVPTEIGLLTRVTELTLLENHGLAGPIPSQIGNLVDLEQLILSSSGFEGSVPSEVRQLSNLLTLYFESNQLGGILDFSLFSDNIMVVYLNGNHFAGTLPSQIGRMANIYRLMLSNNQLTGTVPSELGRLTDLMYLGLSGNGFVGFIPTELCMLSKLVWLNLHDNAFVGHIPEMSRNLVTVTLHNNRFDGSVPASIVQPHPDVGQYKFITFARNFLSCELPESPTILFQKSFVVIGNRFSSNVIPTWLSPYEQSAQFLFVPSTPDWLVLVITLSVGAVLVGCGLFLLSSWRSNVHVNQGAATLEFLMQTDRPSDAPVDGVIASGSKALAFQAEATQIAFRMALLATVFLLPCYVIGANLYECGDPLGKLSLAYLSNAPTVEFAAAVCLSIYIVCAALSIKHLVLTAAEVAEEDVSVEPQSPLQSEIDGQSKVSGSRLCLWVLAMLFFNVPVVGYLFVQNLPGENKLHLSPKSIDIFFFSFPVLLFLESSLMLPLLCHWIFRRSNRIGTELVAQSESNLLVASRLLLVIIVPAVCAIFIEDGCFSGWMTLWNLCDTNELDFQDLGGGSFLVVDTKAICTLQYDSGRCSRRIVDTLSGIMLKKLAIEATLRPSFLLLCSFLRPYTGRRLHRIADVVLSIGRSSSVQAITWVEIGIVFGCVSPIVGLLACLVLWLNHYVGRFLVRRGLVTERQHEKLPRWYLPISVFLTYIFVAWFFLENELNGRYVVLSIFPICLFVWLVYHFIICR